ncbi:MAG: hypothetical protein JXB19_10070 [Bacteroidales bacterium]|nr:hypothetical protein [Bacteroidales bacterium]
MKRLIPTSLIAVLTMVIFDSALLAQARPAEITLQQQKVKFFNQNLQLTASESEKFWPVYNDYQNRRDKITADRNNLLIYFQANSNNMSAAEANDAINRYLSFQQQETELLEAYTKRFSEFLSPKKVMQIYIVELDFRKWLLENLRENRVQTAPRN